MGYSAKCSNSAGTISAGSEGTSWKRSKTPSAENLGNSGSSGSGEASGSSGPRSFTPEQAVRLFTAKLSSYELAEIYSYGVVYFVGSQAKKRNGLVGASQNCG